MILHNNFHIREVTNGGALEDHHISKFVEMSIALDNDIVNID
jgi:hypothetical protein